MDIDDTTPWNWTQTGFNVPLEDILGNAIVVKTGDDPQSAIALSGCCVLGKAAPAAAVPDGRNVIPDFNNLT